tara:strand:- start:412 stop:1020 length:609 start_codon:yes stop_codon:yes gene_type:complete
MPQIIYLLTNPSMPDLVKVGRTSDLETRMRSLYNSSTPVPFECFYACEVNDAEEAERRIHNAFNANRVNQKREFFRINPESIREVLKLIEKKDITPNEDIVEDSSDLNALTHEKEIRSRFKFSMVNIPPNSTLLFSKDETITATVVDDFQIEFEKQITSTSASARTILNRMGYKGIAYQGTHYWNYEGETLLARRLRMETNE